MRYVKKSQEIVDAFQWTGKLFDGNVPEWFGDMIFTKDAWFESMMLYIRSEKGGGIRVEENQYIIKDEYGFYSVCNPAAFETKYKELENL